jgi:ABC-2 type transport system ATP-binding protein
MVLYRDKKKKLFEQLKRTQEVIVAINDITVYHPSGRPIISNVTMPFLEGEIIGGIGESGAGKSTFIKVIIDQQPLRTTGSVKIRGYDVSTDQKQIAPIIGYMPQGVKEIYQGMTAWENIFVFGGFYNLDDKTIKIRAEELFDKLDIHGIQRNELRFEQLSGGEQKRVSLACTLIHQPDVVILDEPTSGLDPIMRHILWQYIEKLNRIYGITFFVVTHFPKEAKYCDKIALFVKSIGFLEYGEPLRILEKLPNHGNIVDVEPEIFSDRALELVEKISGVVHVIQIGESLRLISKLPARTLVEKVLQIFESTVPRIEVHRIEPKRQADMADYLDFVAKKRKRSE